MSFILGFGPKYNDQGVSGVGRKVGRVAIPPPEPSQSRSEQTPAEKMFDTCLTPTQMISYGFNSFHGASPHGPKGGYRQ